MSDRLIYQYPNLTSGILLKRYKRFLADIELETGETITAHCANPGKMLGLAEPGYQVMVSRSDNPKRKLAYSLELVRVEDNEPTWVGVNTSLPNKIVKLALEAKAIPELSDYPEIKPEVVYGRDRKSRVDFLLSGNPDKPPIYLEVKNVTWADGKIARFPDTVTTRGQKHLQELVDTIADLGARSVNLFFINRSDCDTFGPGDAADPKYGKLLRETMAQGLEILPCRFQIDPDGIRYLGLAKLSL
ncbi:DNA/RNA nuclease SfsA [Oxynema aestuarii]|jgi:sugar fermentation stimulation protein A|uniref:Sugar fermentation stimulation protein homolog n=1 Tax=Oxynema aestuarii AP17 TaxID=2064643 RepID=A0A6H1TZF9_9CYAN|nr:DNA/RNA nuclease SfsA [Oxynema aestuarii]QIZ71974.1 DNA/RNA nuclease SfsA [Oxynema aestuarii AP17]RMH72393.1 MAG: DNA/RNA nuclease SfsA [Cyanobacteria bacterium J007]